MVKPELLHLASLLDDDEPTAVNALAELLEHERELGDLPSIFQESDNPMLRRRIHQLQSALMLRRRRREFLQKLNDHDIDLVSGLIDVHLQWFDWDSPVELKRSWDEFKEKSEKKQINSLEDIANFMRRMNFSPEYETTTHPENYCIGTILEQRYGSAGILVAISRELANKPEDFCIVRTMGLFALQDKCGRLLPAARGWQLHIPQIVRKPELWDTKSILRLASLSLFSCAVNSDSFRYVLTIAQALTGEDSDDILEYFPYPYRPKDETTS